MWEWGGNHKSIIPLSPQMVKNEYESPIRTSRFEKLLVLADGTPLYEPIQIIYDNLNKGVEDDNNINIKEVLSSLNDIAECEFSYII